MTSAKDSEVLIFADCTDHVLRPCIGTVNCEVAALEMVVVAEAVIEYNILVSVCFAMKVMFIRI